MVLEMNIQLLKCYKRQKTIICLDDLDVQYIKLHWHGYGPHITVDFINYKLCSPKNFVRSFEAPRLWTNFLDICKSEELNEFFFILILFYF